MRPLIVAWLCAGLALSACSLGEPGAEEVDATMSDDSVGTDRSKDASGNRDSGGDSADASACPGGCDDDNPCTQDWCLADNKCMHDPLDCDDGNACTLDHCEPKNGCTHKPASCPTGQMDCLSVQCSPKTGCTAVPKGDCLSGAVTSCPEKPGHDRGWTQRFVADTPLQLLDIAAHKGRTVLAMKNGAGTITLAMNATGTTLAQRWTEGFTEHLHVGKHGNAWAGTTADSKRRFIVRAGADLVPIWRYETALSATSIVVGALPKNEALAIVTRPPQEDCSVPGGRFGKCDADYLFRFQRIDAGGRVSWSKDISHRSRAGTGHVWRVASSPVSGAVAASVGSFYDGLSDEVSRTLVVQLSPLQTWKVWKSWLRVHRIAIAGSGTVIGGGNRTETPHEGLKLQTWEVRWFTREWPNPSAEPDFGYDESSVQHGCSTGYDALFVTRQDFQKNGLMSEPPLADLWLWRKNQAGETVWGRPLALPAAATPTPLVSESDLRVAQSAKEPVFLAWSASWNHPTKRAEGVVVTQLSPYGGPYCSVDKCSGGDVSDVCDSKGESCKVAWCDAATGCAWKWSEQICGGGYGYPMFCKVGGTCGS